jgi:hypothetical protein
MSSFFFLTIVKLNWMDFCSRTGMWGLCCLAMMQNWAMTTIQTPSVPGNNFPLETFQSSQIWKFSRLSQMQNSCNPSSLQQLIRVRSVQISPTWSTDNSGGGGSAVGEITIPSPWHTCTWSLSVWLPWQTTAWWSCWSTMAQEQGLPIW